MKSAAQILRNKASAAVYGISPDASVVEAVRLMAEKGVGALVVLSAGKLVGIISERDYVRKVAQQPDSCFTGTVSEIMTHEVITVGPSDNSQHCMQLMTDRHLRHLPVVADGELIGLLSIGDLVKQTIADQSALIEQLQRYIRGE